MSHGPGESRFLEEKRHFEKPIPISDLVMLDRERCILCDRCTRFAAEVAGDPLISFIDRGNETQVNTFPGDPFSSYFSGNTVQICPVGALTATPYRFKARPWDLEQVESTCTSCSVGCRVVIQSSRNQVLRYLGVDVDAVNWGWLCDKGRFDFEAVSSSERLAGPLVRDEGLLLKPATWNDAVRRAAAAIQEGLERSGPGGLAVLGGSRLTNEDAYAWVKLAKGIIGSDNVDAQLGDGLPAEAVLGLPPATIDDACRPGGAVLLLGPDPKEELPVLFLRLRHAVLNDDVKIVELAATETGTTDARDPHAALSAGPRAALVRALLAPTDADEEVAGVAPEAIVAAASLLAERPVTVVLGRANLAEGARSIAAAANLVHEAHPHVRFLSALRRANVRGALELGMAPGCPAGAGHAPGRSQLVRRPLAHRPGGQGPRRRRDPAGGVGGQDRHARVARRGSTGGLSGSGPRRTRRRRGPNGDRLRPVPHRVGQAGGRGHARRRVRGGRRDHDQPRGTRLDPGPDRHAPRYRPTRLGDRRRAGLPAGRRPGTRVDRADRQGDREGRPGVRGAASRPGGSRRCGRRAGLPALAEQRRDGRRDHRRDRGRDHGRDQGRDRG